jgi:alginate O-acetyltransferase complex protein AlgI
MHLGSPRHVTGVSISPDVTFIAAVAAVVCALPRMPGFDRLRRLVFASPGCTLAMQTAISLVFVLALGKAVADPFKPFLYFRF